MPGTLIVGDARIDSVVDIARFDMSLKWFFPGVDPAALDPARDWLEPTFLEGDRLSIAIQSFVIRLEGTTILVDTCVGEQKERVRHKLWHERRDTGYLARLAALGLAPEDIDIVFCTHLHADHVGWNTRLENGRWVPTFPNARYVMAKDEVAHWQARLATRPAEEVNHGSFADSVLPVLESGRALLVDADHEIVDGLVVRALPGHTPAHAGLSLRRNGCGCLFTGDAIHHPAQLVQPDWSSALCDDRLRASQTRRRFLAEAADRDDWLVPAHFMDIVGLRIRAHGDGYVPTTPLGSATAVA